jgi:hypothetical protein
VLEGIGRGMTILLVGSAGVGKSTLAAQAAFTIARQLGKRLYWLDADQLKWELIEEAFLRARCSPHEMAGQIIPLYKEHSNGMPDPASAFAVVPSDGVLVLDSLEAWAPRGDKQALEVLRMLRIHPARVKIVVAATNAGGSVAGDGELERAGDATVFVERTQIRVGKCRWTIGAAWARCGVGGLEVERLDDAGPGTGTPVPREGTAPEPDFSLDAIVMAAGWSVREIEGYRARLRAHGVPRDTILGWDRAVDEQRAVLGEVATGVVSLTRTDSTALSESTEAAYAKLMRSWPWKEPVRAKAIAEALRAPGFGDLDGALHDLLGALFASTLSASDIGNALKIVRDVNLDGMRLTRALDRKGVASWRLVRADEI